MSLDETHRARVEGAFANRALLSDPDHRYAVEGVVSALDRGELRVASPPAEPDGEWTVHAWVKQAILLFFSIRKMQKMELQFFEFHDKIPLKRDLDPEVRVVPPAVARYGAYLEPGCILMPSYVNI
ncbi:MAG TPA: 2,3,4,5-tetrahydropyridine-2,6-dicarboxylate N-succinyltransferase, partial [Polyangiaceae bacterium]